jgi:hypothetical protein
VASAQAEAGSNPRLGLRPPQRVGAGEPSGEPGGSGVKAALTLQFRLVRLPRRAESFSDDLV